MLFAAALLACALMAPLDASAAFDFAGAWGKDVDLANPGTGFEFCLASCKSGVFAGGTGELNQPGGVATDGAGNVYVADFGNNRISVYRSDGRFVRAWGKDVDAANPGTGFEVCTTSCKSGDSTGDPGAMAGPAGIDVDPGGSVYVDEVFNNRVSVFTTDGTFLRSWGKDVVPGGATATEVCTVTCKAGEPGTGPGELTNPAGLATDGAGSVYVADTGSHRVQQFTSAGTFARAWGKDVVPSGGTGFETCTSSCKDGVPGGGGGEQNVPLGMALSGGDLYLADSGNHRVQVFGLGAPSVTLLRAFGKDVDPGGGTGFEVCATSCKSGVVGGDSGAMNALQDLAFDGAGRLFVADYGNYRVDEFRPAGAFVQAWGKDVNPAGGTAFETCSSSCKEGVPGGAGGELNAAIGLDSGCCGDLFVAEDSNNRVSKFAEPAAPLPGGDSTLPILSALNLKPATFPAAGKGASTARKRRRKTGTTVRFSMTEAGRVAFTVERRLAGRLVGRRCLAPKRSNRKRRHCARYRRLKGSFSRAAVQGSNRFHFTGRLRRRKLRPGRYLLVAVPTDNAGNRGRRVRRAFRIKR